MQKLWKKPRTAIVGLTLGFLYIVWGIRKCTMSSSLLWEVWRARRPQGHSITCLGMTAPHSTVGFYSVQVNSIWNLSDSLFCPFVQICRICIWGSMFCYIFEYWRTSKRSVLGYHCIPWDTITLKSRVSHIKKAIQKDIWTFIFLTLEDFFR